MSVFGNILAKIFHRKEAPKPPAAAPAPKAAPAPAPTAAAAAPVAAAPPPEPVDVEAVLTEMAAANSQKLDWRHSIVDLMKLLDLDSSLGERKSLAQELGYTGELNGSAEMNLWLHRQVMKKLAENGGKVPAALKD